MGELCGQGPQAIAGGNLCSNFELSHVKYLSFSFIVFSHDLFENLINERIF